MNKADVCINHTTAVNYGYTSTKFVKMNNALKVKPGKNHTGFDKLLSYLDPPTTADSPLEYFQAENVKNHSTTLFSFVKDSKRYVWYNNPWGYDSSEIRDIDESVNVEGLPDSSIEDLKRQGLDVPKGIDYHLLYDYNAHRVMRYVEKFLPYHQYRSLYEKYRCWNPRRVARDYHHPMNLLYLLKILTNADHLELLHPRDTMPCYGPQTTDGVDPDVPKLSEYGACSLWTCMYIEKVEKFIGGQLSNPRRDIGSILRTIKQSLNSKSLHGKIDKDMSKRSTLAHGLDDFQFSMKAILALVYDVIPEKDVVDGYTVTSRKRKISNVAGGWHTMVFRKLTNIFHIVSGIYHKIDGSTHTVQTVQEGEILREKLLSQVRDTIIAGYIETFAIVSGEDETNNGLTYLDKTAHIATFVLKNNLTCIDDFSQFIDATKDLIACKHNDDPENADIPRQTHAKLSAPTRFMRENHDRILRDTHAKLFKYNLGDRQREIENKKIRPA